MRLIVRSVLSCALIVIPSTVRAQAPVVQSIGELAAKSTDQLQLDFRFAPADSSLVGAIKVGNLLRSPLVKAGLEEARKSNPSTGPMVGMAMGILSEIREIRFAAVEPQAAPAALAKAAKGGAPRVMTAAAPQPDMVMLIDGKLDDSLVAMLTQASSGANANTKIGGQPAVFRRLDADTLLVGTEALVTQAEARLRTPLAGVGVLGSRAFLQRSALSQEHDIWFAGRIPDVPMTAGTAANLKSVAVGLRFSDPNSQGDTVLEAALEATTRELAESLIRMAREAAAGQPEVAGLTWDRLLQTSQEGATAHFFIRLPADRMEQAMGEALRIRKTAVPAPGLREPPTPVQPPVRKIRIQGLSEGPVEIPLQ